MEFIAIIVAVLVVGAFFWNRRESKKPDEALPPASAPTKEPMPEQQGK